MTKFNPENKDTLTYGECLSPAMEIKSLKDAKQYFEAYVNHIQKYLDSEPRDDNMTAEDIARTNLGYFAGYYNDETRERVESLFTCSHPIFGTIKTHGQPSAEQALRSGMDLAQNQK